jgi:hypothetical protein
VGDGVSADEGSSATEGAGVTDASRLSQGGRGGDAGYAREAARDVEFGSSAKLAKAPVSEGPREIRSQGDAEQ